MTPKEKAIELISNLDGSKYYANYCINEILQSLDDEWTKIDFWTEELAETIEYWQQVKQEIEKL